MRGITQKGMRNGLIFHTTPTKK